MTTKSKPICFVVGCDDTILRCDDILAWALPKGDVKEPGSFERACGKEYERYREKELYDDIDLLGAFNESVGRLLDGQKVVFVSGCRSDKEFGDKSFAVNRFAGKYNVDRLTNHPELLSFNNLGEEWVDNYVDLIKTLKDDYRVICVDDDVNRLVMAYTYGCLGIQVGRHFNFGCGHLRWHGDVN